MKFFVLLISLIAAHVSCDIGIGYRYKVPVSSYEVPFGSVGTLDKGRQYYHVNNHAFNTGSLVGTTPSTVLRTPIHEHTSFTGNQDFSLNRNSPTVTSTLNAGSLNSRSQVTSTKDVSSFNLLGSSLKNGHSSSENVAFDPRSSFDGQFNGQIDAQHSGQVEVNKHFYFFAAPEEPEEVRPRIKLPVAPPKKDVKILFIKAPSFPAPAPVQIPVQPQNQEKTLVYVLVKKPEEQEPIVIPTATPTKPAKPEVYFIKYKTEKEAHDVISNVRQDGTTGVDQSSLINRIGSIDDFTGFQQKLGSADLRSSGEAGNIQVSSEGSYSDGSFSSGISGSQQLLVNNAQGIGSTTVSSLSVPTGSGVDSGELGVHKVYGPPHFTENT